MENSFSLQFNKMTQLKTVQEYENEITRLQNENWEIRHQLAYLKSNNQPIVDEKVQKLLYDSKASIDILENENKNFQRQIEHMKEIIRNNAIEKEKATKDNNDKISEIECKLLGVEDENQRLLLHIENLKNKYERVQQEHKNCSEEIKNLQNNIESLAKTNQNTNLLKIENQNLKNELTNLNSNFMNLQNEIYNLKNEKAIYFTEGEKLHNEKEILQKQCKNLYDERTALYNSNNEFKEKLKMVEKEHKELKEKIQFLETELNHSKESSLHLKELQKHFNKETRDKQRIAIENEEIKNELENANKKIEILINEKRAMKYKLTLNEGHILKHAILELKAFAEDVRGITSKVEGLKISNENYKFLQTINIHHGNINDTLAAIQNIYIKMKNKIEVLRRENYDLSKFNKNEKIMNVVKEFAEEFKKARNDLDLTKKYLEQKNTEIKEIKKEKMGLEKMYNKLLVKVNKASCYL